MKLVWIERRKIRDRERGKGKGRECNNQSFNGSDKEKEEEGEKEIYRDEFPSSYLAVMSTIIGSDICVQCRGTRFAGPFLVCGTCNGA